MLFASTVLVGWYASIQQASVSEPLWFAAWGVGLIGAAMLARAVGARV
jgi:short subunit fatty acids transporter